MMHDDGQHVEAWKEADVVLVGVSRTSKPDLDLSRQPRHPHRERPAGAGHPDPASTGDAEEAAGTSAYATPERLIQVRQNRLLSMGDRDNDTYIDRQAVTDEVAFARRLSAKFNWAQLDVTRRSIEETAAAILKLFTDRQRQRISE
jgi:regulator of PEP synthase PpsR (kinase-PPPase family)